ncbi:hypothetical protein PFISCL1PPCAC_4937, partial [Pristionchus fissidentatus]
MDFEMYQFMAEHFADIYVVVAGKLLAFVFTYSIIIMTKTAHRVKILSLFQCCILFLLVLRRIMIKYDGQNV